MRLFKKYVLIYLLVNGIGVNAQVNSIHLPKGEEEIRIKSITPIFSIYVDAKNRVYLEKEPINVYDIAKKLSFARYKLPEDLKMRIKIHLYIDKKTGYATVDLIKTQLASAYFDQVYYKTNSIEDKDVLKGIFWSCHYSFFKLQSITKTQTDREIQKNKRYNDSLMKLNVFNEIIIPPPPPPFSWVLANRHKIYSDNQEAIDEALKNKNYRCIVLTNKGFEFNDITIDYDNFKKLTSSLLPYHVIFIKFDKDLIYSNYFEAIQNFKKIRKSNKINFMELSNEILEIHKKSNLSLCN